MSQFIEALCVCEYASVLIPVAEILERASNAQLCTSSQCFESIHDMVPMHVPSNDVHAWLDVFFFIGVALMSLQSFKIFSQSTSC